NRAGLDRCQCASASARSAGATTICRNWAATRRSKPASPRRVWRGSKGSSSATNFEFCNLLPSHPVSRQGADAPELGGGDLSGLTADRRPLPYRFRFVGCRKWQNPLVLTQAQLSLLLERDRLGADKARKSGLQLPLRWREQDSNHRS